MAGQDEDILLNDEYFDLQNKIHSITKYQKPYTAKSLKKMAQESPLKNRRRIHDERRRRPFIRGDS